MKWREHIPGESNCVCKDGKDGGTFLELKEVHGAWNKENQEETNMRIMLEGKQGLDGVGACKLS